jgi:hypothetical protein
MTQPRFQFLGVVNKGFYIAEILDTKIGRVYKIRQKGSKLLHWDKQDEPVSNPTLRKLAREALEGAGA